MQGKQLKVGSVMLIP